MEDLLSLLQKYSCQLVDNKFVLTQSETLGEHFNYGVELEYLYAPDIERMSCIAFILNTDLLEYDDFRLHLRNSLLKLSPLQMEPMKMDGENDEVVLYPLTLQAFRSLAGHFSVLFKSLKSNGYEPWSPVHEIGFHISVDKNMLTSEAMRRLLWWVYYNNKFFVWISGRRNLATARADIWHLIGDKYHMWEESFRYSRAEDLFNSWVQRFTDDMFFNIAGFRTYHDRPYIQFTHFASTLDVNELLTKIEFVDSLLYWCIDREDYNIHNYLNNIDAYEYPRLFDSLKALNL